MNPIVHGELGWLIAQGLERRRDRIAVTLAALAPDLDGLVIVFGEQHYAYLHHKLSHGLLAAVMIPLVAGTLCRSLKVAALALVAFHSHVVTDLMGSGPGWPIYYWWPFSNEEWLPSWQWDLASWQNSVIGLLVTLTCLSCARFFGRTPVELFHRKADAAVVKAVQGRIGGAA